jgi:hypothetical protein
VSFALPLSLPANPAELVVGATFVKRIQKDTVLKGFTVGSIEKIEPRSNLNKDQDFFGAEEVVGGSGTTDGDNSSGETRRMTIGRKGI